MCFGLCRWRRWRERMQNRSGSTATTDIDERNEIKFFKIPSFSFFNFAFFSLSPPFFCCYSNYFLRLAVQPLLASERTERDGHKNAYKKRRKHFRWILKAIVCLMRSCRRFSHLNNNFLNYFPPLCRPLGFGCCLRWDLWTRCYSWFCYAHSHWALFILCTLFRSSSLFIFTNKMLHCVFSSWWYAMQWGIRVAFCLSLDVVDSVFSSLRDVIASHLYAGTILHAKFSLSPPEFNIQLWVLGYFSPLFSNSKTKTQKTFPRHRCNIKLTWVCP